jgi:hypothetical protein
MSDWITRHEALKARARAKLETMPDDEIRDLLIKAGYKTAQKDFVCSDGRIDTMGREQMINLAVSGLALGDWVDRLSGTS